jgi:hypothetical protein
MTKEKALKGTERMSNCKAQASVANPVHPGKQKHYFCALPLGHRGEHVSETDPEKIAYVWEDEDPVAAEREACAQIADTYRSTSAGRAIALLIRGRGQP